MAKWKRALLWCAACVVACVAYFWFFGIQTFCALETRNIGRRVPLVKSVPSELSDHSVSQASGRRLSFLGAEFEVPWDDLDESKTRIVGNWVLIDFRSGKSIILCVSPPNGFIADMSKDKTPDPELFAALYGREVLRSDYALKKAIFETTPSEINLLTPAHRAVGLSSVILIKAIMPPTTDWGIYNISSGEFKGFQLGNPARRPKKMCLELYGNDRSISLRLLGPLLGSRRLS